MDERNETRRWLMEIAIGMGVPIQVEGDQHREPHEAWRGIYTRIMAHLQNATGHSRQEGESNA